MLASGCGGLVLQVAAAKGLVGDDKVDAAIDLVDFDPELRPAMEHAFGSTFICKVRIINGLGSACRTEVGLTT